MHILYVYADVYVDPGSKTPGLYPVLALGKQGQSEGRNPVPKQGQRVWGPPPAKSRSHISISVCLSVEVYMHCMCMYIICMYTYM